MAEQHPADTAIDAIESAPLSATAYRAARRLLDQVDLHNGYVRLTHARLMDICGVTQLPSARRLLGSLKRAGILHYTINAESHVTFDAWACENGSQAIQNGSLTIQNGSMRPTAVIRNGSYKIQNGSPLRIPMIHNGSPTIQNGSSDATDGDQRAESDHPRSEMDHPRSDLDQNGLPIGGWYPDPTLVEGDTNHGNSAPATNGNGHSNGVEEATAVGLLTSGHVALSGAKAKQLAAAYPFQEIRRQVFHWLPEAEKGRAGPGALIKRIENGWSVPEPTAEMRRHPLWKQFRLPAEREADEAVEADVHDAMAAQRERWQEAAAESAPEPIPADQGDIWPEVMARLQDYTQAGGLTWLEGSRLEEAGAVEDTPLYRVILAGGEGRSWVESRLGPMIRRTIGMVVGHPVLIEVVTEDEREPAQEATTA